MAGIFGAEFATGRRAQNKVLYKPHWAKIHLSSTSAKCNSKQHSAAGFTLTVKLDQASKEDDPAV
eukprot:gene7398-6942_t